MNKTIKKFFVATAGVAMAFGVAAGLANSKLIRLNAESNTFAFSSTYQGSSGSGVEKTFTWSNSVLTVSQKGNGATQPNDNYTTAPRWYGTANNQNLCTFTPAAGVTITQMVFTVSQGSFEAGTWSNGSISTNTWTGSQSSSFTFLPTAQVRPTSIAITYSTGSGGGGSSSSPQAPTTFTVTYNANGGTGEITDSNSPYVSGTTVTVKSSEGLTAPYPDMIFDKWTTNKNGSGTEYAPGATFNISADTTLYAQWIDDPSIPYISSYSTGFNSTEGFSNSSSYNSEKDDGPSGKQWHIYYGTASSTSPLSGNQSLQMRWYGNAANNFPYSQTKFPILEVKRISFKYKVSNSNLDFIVQYNTDGGENWTDIETVNTPDYNEHSYRKVFDSTIPSLYFKVLVCSGGQAPGSGKNYEFRIDDIAFDSVSVPATINGNDTVKVGSQWSPTDITEDDGGAVVTGATYSFVNSNGATILSSNTSTGSFTCSSEGTMTVKATKSGYLIAEKTVTVQPADAFVNNLSKTSVSAYTGEHETISFSYGGLNVLSMESNDTDVVTFQDLSYSAGSGSVRLNYVGAGSTTVLFKDGETPLAAITVSVEESTVTISGLPSTKSIYAGRTFNLGATISVSHTGSCSDDVTWESSDDDVALVSSAGVVTGVAAGTADITVASVSYPSATMTCAVTVSEVPTAFFIDFGDVKNTNPSELSTATFLSTFSVDSKVSCTAITKVCATDNTNMLKMGSNSSSSSITLKIPSMFYITKVEAEVFEGNNLSLEVQSGATDSTKESQSASTAGTYIFDDYLSAERSSIVTISTSTTKAIYLTSLILHYEARVNNISTQTKLSYRYQDNGNGSFDYYDISIRFGGLISKALWDELDTDEHLISGFGVMIGDGSLLDESDLIKDNLDLKASADDNPAPTFETAGIIDYYMSKAEMATPVEQGDNYYWNLFQRVDPADVSDVFVAVAYIKVGNDYVFMNQVRYSVESLAADYINSRGYNNQSAEGSLYSLAEPALA